MRNSISFIASLALGSFLFSCSASKSDVVSSGTAFTVQEIMQSMVQPRADNLWNAVAISATEKGIETKAPGNDEEWANIRHEAVTLAESMNLILMPGRKIAPPGVKANDPKVELGPDQIQELIAQDRASWSKMARDLQDSVMVAVQAIDAKNADGLSKAGDGINTACETCHKKYWHPNDEKAQQD